MQSQHTFAVSFYLKQENGRKTKAPIYVRITVDGQYVRLAVKRSVEPKFWNQRDQKLIGNSPEIISLRDKLRQVQNEINAAYDELRYLKKPITAQTIKSRIDGSDVDKTLTYLIDYHFEGPGQLLSPGTLKNYYSTKRFLYEFMRKRKQKDVMLMHIDYKFIYEFGLYLRKKKTDRGQKPCTNNGVMKHMERFKKLTTLAIKLGWMSADPFVNYKRSFVKKDRECLDNQEIAVLWSLELIVPVERIVRDMFLFSCYTGLSFIEISRFSLKDVQVDLNGDHWLEMVRQKTMNITELKFNVLLLPEALQLIEDYKEDMLHDDRTTVFPCPTNQHTNRSLKRIAELAGIEKHLTFHVARHTFATTITLENGVSIESVAHMLGHTSTRTTQIYAKVKKKKVANEMGDLRRKLQMKVHKAI
ncbi:site-specific integrase [Pedobacter aquatilis]|uniref:site-specific integrase n=1 Tax=Pedobacter aquatilis TaxID=351343 RepID=UPI00292F0820|nr:site-specific integrase [Pedobacter aquatilis]